MLVYRTRVPTHVWYDPHERAALIDRLKSEDRCPIGYDESLVDDGVILLISVDGEELDSGSDLVSREGGPRSTTATGRHRG